MLYGHLTRRRCAVLALLILALAATSLSTLAISEEGQGFKATITGRKTFTLGYGIGSAVGLSLAGASPYQLSLNQTLAVDITGEALDVLTLKAHFNDQEPASMQSLTLHLDLGNLTGVFGDFSLSGTESFAAYNKKLKGIRLDYKLGDATVTGILSQIEGISESQTFVGRKAHAQVTFSASPAGQPWIEKPYRQNIAGLYAYPLSAPYIQGFSQVGLTFQPSSALQSLLSNYDLSYLYPAIQDSPSWDAPTGSFVVVSDDQQTLLLKQSPRTLLRNELQEAISTYNQDNDLTGTDAKIYPFNEGTDYEIAFLDKLAAHVALTVDEATYPLTSGVQHRFYDLGQTDVNADSLDIELSLDGQTFQPISNPDFTDYTTTLYAADGILEVDFPKSFFESGKSAIQVDYDYAISGNVFMLGLSVVPGSEKVYLNGTLLKRDVDYSIDYDVGTLVLFKTVTDSDTVRIDYERYRGGLGGSAEYTRNFYGATLDLPVSSALKLQVSLLQAADNPTPLASDPATVRTMPETHTVSGVAGTVTLDNFSGQFTIGYNDDRFPFDNNLRKNLPNRVTAILPLSNMTLVGTLAGLSVQQVGVWHEYGPSDGLSSSRIYAMTSAGNRVFFATSAGLTVLNLTGSAPLAQVSNWLRYSVSDGLPNADVHSVLVRSSTVWVGTAGGLARCPVSALDDPSSWVVYTSGDFADSGTIDALAWYQGSLYVGTDSGLYAFDPTSETLTPVDGTSGLAINALLANGETLYLATDSGLCSLDNGTALTWLEAGDAVHSLGLADGTLWWGTSAGLYSSTGQTRFDGWTVSALGVGPNGTLWAGSQANTDYTFDVWRVGETTTVYDNVQLKIDGKDPSRFANVSAVGHTDRGLMTQLSFQRDYDKGTLSGTFENISPQFTAIGRLSRTDSIGWSLQGSAQPADWIRIKGSNSYHQLDRSSDDPKTSLANDVSLSLDVGPTIGLSFHQGAVNDNPEYTGFDNGVVSYAFSASDQLFDKLLDLSLNWQDQFSWNSVSDTAKRQNRLGARATLHFTPEITLSTSWGRPMTFSSGSATGSQAWNLNGSWSARFTIAQSRLTYTLDAQRSLPGGDIETTQEAKANVSFNSFSLASWQLTPTVLLTATNKEGLIGLEGQGTLRTALSPFSAQTTYDYKITGLGETSTRINHRLSVSVGYTGIPDLHPSLSYSRNTSAVTYLGQVRGTTNRNLTGALTWSPPDGSRDRLSVSIRGVTQNETTTVSANLHNTYSMSIALFDPSVLAHPLGLRFDLDGQYQQAATGPTLTASAQGQGDLTLSDTWSASLSARYLTGTQSTGGLYHSLFFQLTIAATF
jgi:hypothetical protein